MDSFNYPSLPKFHFTTIQSALQYLLFLSSTEDTEYADSAANLIKHNCLAVRNYGDKALWPNVQGALKQHDGLLSAKYIKGFLHNIPDELREDRRSFAALTRCLFYALFTIGSKTAYLPPGLNMGEVRYIISKLNTVRANIRDNRLFPSQVRFIFDKDSDITYPKEIIEVQIAQMEPSDFEGSINVNQTPNPMENTMTRLAQFEDVPSATPHLIHGKPAESYTEAELMGLIRKARKEQESLKDLADISTRVKAKVEALGEAIKVYVEALDGLAE